MVNNLVERRRKRSIQVVAGEAQETEIVCSCQFRRYPAGEPIAFQAQRDEMFQSA